MEELAVRLWKDEDGQSVVEYALLLVLVSLVAVSSMKSLATTVSTVFSDATGDITGYLAPAQMGGNQVSSTGQASEGGTSSQLGWGIDSGTQTKFNNNNINNIK